MALGRLFFRPTTLSALAALYSSACAGPNCDRNPDNKTHKYSEGWTNASRTYFTTGHNNEPFLHFPSGRIYRLEHNLLAAPETYEARIAFSACPFSEEVSEPGERPRCAPVRLDVDAQGAAENAGNQVVFHHPTDTSIEVRNDTCADVYVRVWAEIPSGLYDEPTAGDAGTGASPND